MKRNILTYADFLKASPKKVESKPAVIKGEHDLVKDHYDEIKPKELDEPKNSEVKGGTVEHTEEIKADDLGDPKNANVE